MPSRRRLARALLLDLTFPRWLAGGRAWVGLLVSGALVSAYLFAHRAEAQKSREIGRAIVEFCSALHGYAVTADGVIEARPDALLYARQRAREREGTAYFRFVWDKPGLASVIYARFDMPRDLTLSRADVNEHAPYRQDNVRAEWTLGRYRLILHGWGWGSALPADESGFFPVIPDESPAPVPSPVPSPAP